MKEVQLRLEAKVCGVGGRSVMREVLPEDAIQGLFLHHDVNFPLRYITIFIHGYEDQKVHFGALLLF